MPTSLAGKTALVTGGSRGIGRAIAERLAAEGAVVALTYHSAKAGAEAAVAAIEAAGGRAFALQADLADPAVIPALLERVTRELTVRTGSGALDILVNNAGTAGFGGVTDATVESWETMFAVFARAPFFTVQAALPHLSDGGRIVNISSGFATRPAPVAAMYSMAKGAINTMTHALAMELGPRRITVNAVAPGWTRTDMNSAVRENPAMLAAIESDTALGRFGEPEDIATTVAFLASDDARWLTGQVVEASGGYRL